MSIHPDDYDIEQVQTAWIGQCVSESQGRYPVEYDAIRRHCHMTEDTNPLFLDPEFARTNGPYGAVVVPPSLLPRYFASNGPWPPKTSSEQSDRDHKGARPSFTLGVPTPGDRGINMGTELSFLEPIRIGDLLRYELHITDVFLKAIKLDQHAVWIVSEYSFYNQHDDKVATWKNTTLVHRSPKQIAEHDSRNSDACS